jgi:hypothetical protein
MLCGDHYLLKNAVIYRRHRTLQGSVAVSRLRENEAVLSRSWESANFCVCVSQHLQMQFEAREEFASFGVVGRQLFSVQG